MCINIKVGNVGIGTASPRSNLHLGSLNPTTTLGLQATAGYSQNEHIGTLAWYNSDASSSGPQEVAYITVGADTSVGAGGHMDFWTNTGLTGEGDPPVQRMRIDAGGNVGIATTTPADLMSIGNSGSLIIGNGDDQVGAALCFLTGGEIGRCDDAVDGSGECTCSTLD